MLQANFIRPFWIATGLTIAALLLLLNRTWNPDKLGLPSRCEFPVPGDRFIWNYTKGGLPAHYFYYFRMFGFGDKIEKSDVLLLGTSHTAFGLSAKDLSDQLTEQEGKKVRVFNMGLGYAEEFGFISEVLKRNHVQGKTLIADTYSPKDDGSFGITALGQQVMEGNLLKAHLQVGKIYASFTRDWLLDPFLPCFKIGRGNGPHGITVERFLGRIFISKVSSGDICEYWTEKGGNVFTRKKNAALQSKTTKRANAGMVKAATLRRFLENPQNRIIFTFIPTPGFERSVVPKNATPFIAISGEEITVCDGAHLSRKGSKLTTERLVEGLKKAGLSVLPPPAPSAP